MTTWLRRGEGYKRARNIGLSVFELATRFKVLVYNIELLKTVKSKTKDEVNVTH